MSENPGSNDKSIETLDFIINVLKEHEKNFDNTIDELSTVVEQIRKTTIGLKGKVEESEEKIATLQKGVTNLIGYLSNPSKNASFDVLNQQKAQIQTAPAVSPPAIQDKPTSILRCNQWSDFQDLATRTQKLSFSYAEDEKVFQTNAISGNQMIMYVGALPDLSVILKKWLSGLLNIDEKDILEGYWISPK